MSAMRPPSPMAPPVPASVTCTTAATRVLCVHSSALRTAQRKPASTAHTSESRPGRSVPVSSMEVYSSDGTMPTMFRASG
uniref:Uncharacterized protein n=1 Tax=Arundo donax TaxID=35708 RepID=A0A0A9BVU9_ARUDO